MRPRLMPWLFDRMLGKSRPATKAASRFEAPVLMGIMEFQGQIYLCDPNLKATGITVKLAHVPPELRERYDEVEPRWFQLQAELALLPRSLRPRRKAEREKVVSERVKVTAE